MTYAGGAALAAFVGVLAAPIYSVNPNMGENLMITVFAIVVIGGMGSILGSIVAGVGLGLAEGLAKIFYPQGSVTVIFLVMAGRAADCARPVQRGRIIQPRKRGSRALDGCVLRRCGRGCGRARAIRQRIWLPDAASASLPAIMFALIAVLPALSSTPYS